MHQQTVAMMMSLVQLRAGAVGIVTQRDDVIAIVTTVGDVVLLSG